MTSSTSAHAPARVDVTTAEVLSPPEWSTPRIAGYTRLSSDALRPLTAVDLTASLGALAFDVAVITATLVLVHQVRSAWLYVPAVLVIGARQQGLIVLMHEAAHKGLLRPAWLNDLIGEVVLAWPLFISMFAYRANHMGHHRHLNTPQDPDWLRYRTPQSPDAEDWRAPRPLWHVVRPLLKDLVGLNAVDQLRRVRRLRPTGARGSPHLPSPRVWRGLRLAFYAALATVLTLTGSWVPFLLYWVVPALTMLKTCLRMRQLAAHYAIFGGDGMRTTRPSPWERFFLGPHHIGYHVEHHLYPGVRFHQLPRLHRQLLARGDYAGTHPFRLTEGYLEMLRDWGREAPAQRLLQQHSLARHPAGEHPPSP